jgi:hypothetical protein
MENLWNLNMAKFSEKLAELLELGKKEKEHSGISGDQRLLSGYAIGCGTDGESV